MMRIWIGYGGVADYELTNRPEWAVTEAEGISASEVELNVQGVAGRDGSFVRGPKLNSRVITLRFALINQAQSARRTLLEKFEPKRAVTLTFSDNKALSIDGYVQNLTVSQDEPTERLEARIYCPDPWFRGEEYVSAPTQSSLSFQAPARGQGWRLELYATRKTSLTTVTVNDIVWTIPALPLPTTGRNTVILDTRTSPPIYTRNDADWWDHWPIDKDLPELKESNSITVSSSYWRIIASYYTREWGF